jgi:YesN/AraC family two-component response regulator
MLVDDEYLELEMLEKHVPWQEMGFTVPAVASDGLEALALLENIRPDVIVTDVKMPFMDGIAFSAKARELYPGIRLVFLSGYSQFDYVKAALKVGADDYVLKPVDLAEFEKLMKAVKLRCDEQYARRTMEKAAVSEQVREILTQDAIKEEPSSDSILALCAGYFELNAPSHLYWPAVITVDESRYLQQNRDILGFSLNDVRNAAQSIAALLPCMFLELKTNVYFLIAPADPSRVLEAWKNEKNEEQGFITVVYDSAPIPACDLKARYTSLLLLRHDLVLLSGSGQFKSAGDLKHLSENPVRPDDSLPDDLKLAKALLANDTEYVKSWLNTFFSRKCGNIHIQAIEMLDKMDAQLGISARRHELSSEKKVALFKRLLDVESIPLLHHMVETHLFRIMSLLTPGAWDSRENMVRDIRQYIEANYHKPFTIDHLAGTLNYSPNYIRFVFNQVTGHTVLEEITEVRMEKAAAMLQNTPLKIRQISDKVGYTNPSYFCNQFIKRYGITPLQYRGRVSP